MTESGGPPRRTPFSRLRLKAETLIVLALTLALAASYLAARDVTVFQAIEGQTLDWRFRLRGPQPVSRNIVIVAIDDRTLAELGRWPFSRTWLAAAIDAIAADGASSIVFDLLLIGPESPEAPAESPGPKAPGTVSPLVTVTSDADRALVDAISRAGNVVVPFAFVYEEAAANVSELPPAIESAAYPIVRSAAGQPAERAEEPAGALVPLTPFLAAGIPAHATVFVDADGGLRSSHPAVGYGGSYYPSLAVEGVRLFLGADRESLSLELGKGLSIEGRFFPTDSDTALPINYAGPSDMFETWSLIDVARQDFAPGSFRERLVLIGSSAAGLSDRFETPYTTTLAGVEVFANVADNFLGRGFLRRTLEIEWIDLLAIVLGGLLTAALGLLRRPAAAMLAAFALICVWSAVSFYSFIAWQVWLNYTFPFLAMLLGAMVVTAGLATRETRRRTDAEQHGATLSRYVSPLAILNLKSRESRADTATTQLAAVMFVDIIGYTHISECIEPPAVARLLRRFHGRIEQVAQAHGGVIDKFIGDAALVVFGASAGSVSDAANAIACARRIAEELGDDENADLPKATCGIGIDFGEVAITEVGGSAHAEISIAGDTVNVASRLEALTREWATTIIITDAAFEAARDAGASGVLEGFQELPVKRVRGRDRPVRLWAWPAPGNA